MIYKSYLIEKNLDLLKNNLILFYGENFGLIKEFQENYKRKHKKIIKFNQLEIINNEDKLINEIKNVSLFESRKYIFIDEVSDKIFKIIDEIKDDLRDNRIYLFANILEKKSKLRSFFEKYKNCDVIPCYEDNKESIKNLITNELKGFSGINQEVLNIFYDNCGFDRVKINNELVKIKTYFTDKKIKIEQLEKLLNQKNDDDFIFIRDAVLKGNKQPTNKFLSSTLLDNDKITYYLYLLHLRLIKLEEIVNLSEKQGLTNAINNIKPPIFWKDKPHFIDQAKMWNTRKIKTALKKTYSLEINIKSNSNTNKNILIKKHLLDLCLLANS